MTMMTMKNVPQATLPWNRQLMPGQWHLFPEVGIDVGLVEFTPDIWEKILESHNNSNRPVSDRQVKFLSHVLTSNQWMVTGETIIFSSEQQCLNGQQRGLACKETGIPFKSLVAVGVTPAAFKVMDQHRKRSLGQVLSVEGHTSTNLLAGSLNWIACFFLRGYLGQHPGSNRGGLSTDDYLQLLDKHPDLTEWVTHVIAYKSTKLFSGGSLPIAFLYLTSQVNEPLARRMIHVMIHSTIPEAAEWNGVRLLTKQLQDNLASRKKLPAGDIAALMIKVWNSLLTGKAMKLLQYKVGEECPKITGWVYEDNRPVQAVFTECPHYPEKK